MLVIYTYISGSAAQTWVCITITWEACFKKRFLAPTRASESVGPGWGLRICISNELPGDAAADAASQGTSLWELLI